MTDEIPEICPACDPDHDFDGMVVSWCGLHMPGRVGLDDARVLDTLPISGTGECGGEANRRWCELLHRGQ